ncbi:MAG: DUF1016 domain-containing protein [bacterium]|nr:DUF1016 domain-containing protein [bacterium]
MPIFPGFIPKLARDIKNEFPEIKGFSERDIRRMIAFYREYPILPQPGAKLASLISQIPWRHNILLIEKVKDLEERLWYIQQTLESGWSRNILDMQIKSNSFARKGKALTNFDKTLPPEQSNLATQTLKDPYIFDFLTLDSDFRERELEEEFRRGTEKIPA